MTDRRRGPLPPPSRAPEPQTARPGHLPRHDVDPATGRPAAVGPGLRISQPANDPRFPPSPDVRSVGTGGPGSPNRARGSRFRWLKRFTVFLAVVLGIGLVAIAGLHVRLSKGPIDIPLLVGPLEDGLNRELGENQVRIGAVVLFRSERTNRIEFRLRDVQLVDGAGITVARAPTAAIDLSRNALLSGTIAPKRIELIRPRLLLSYNERGVLSLRFAGFQKSGAAAASGDSQVGETASPVSDDAGASSTKSVGIVDILKDAFKTARERRTSTSSLRHVGIRDALIIFRTPKRQTVWAAPSLGFALQHQSSRSVIRGDGTLSDGGAPWQFAFEIDDTPARGAFQVRTLFKDMIPGEFGRAIPVLADLQALETPLSGQAEFQLAQDGTLASASADVVLGAGYMRHGYAEEGGGLLLDEGHVKFSYVAQSGGVHLEKLDLLSADGRLVLAGSIRPSLVEQSTWWDFDLKGKLRFSSQPGSDPTPLGDIAFRGAADPSTGAARFDGINVTWPDGALAGRAQVTETGGITIDGQIGEMPKSGLFQAWPPFVLADVRSWVEQNVDAELVTGGQFSFSLPANFSERLREGADIPAEAVSLDLHTRNAAVTYNSDLARLRLPTASASLRGRTFRIKAPHGFVALPSGARLAFEQSDFVVRDLRLDDPEAQVFMKVAGSAGAVIEYLEQKELGLFKSGTVPASFSGDAQGVLRFRFPVQETLSRSEIKLIGKVNLDNAAARDVLGGMNIAGGAIVFDVTEKAIEATGDILVNGVPAKVRWLRLLEGGEDKQPPLRIAARLDAADRKQIGININHIVDGTIAADVTIVPGAGGKPRVMVQADLTPAEIGLDYLSWTKPAGKAALVQFDVVENDKGLVELHNFKVVGDDIAIDGWVGLGADNRVRKFALPEFSVDLITRMEIEGALGRDDVWDVKVRATTFDARPLFRNFFTPKRLAQHLPAKDVRRSGLVIRAFIKTLVGFSDESMKDVRVVLQRRDGKLISLEANGALNSGAPLAARIAPEPGQQRVLLAETKDAGQAFRLIGFYKNIRRGEAKLQVNLDQPGRADLSGTLWTRNFYMLGDPVVNTVLKDNGDPKSGSVQGIQTQRDEGGAKRTVIQFDQLRAAFSVGNGQFLLEKSFINGPALGATLRGKVDFGRRQVKLGGTYVPLYGLNAALGSVPILGELFVGRRGEGIVGITFGVQGNLDNPEVLVNPVSLVAPGIFRQIFEINPSKQRITPRKKSQPSRGGGAPKASSAPAYSAPTGKNGSNWPNSGSSN